MKNIILKNPINYLFEAINITQVYIDAGQVANIMIWVSCEYNYALMKQELVKAHNQYDIHAHQNHQKIKNIKHQVYREQIDSTIIRDQLTETQFAIKPLEIGFIQSLTLKDDLKFKQIQKIFAKYNQDAIQYNYRAIDGLHLKTVVMESMLKFLRLMFLAPDGSTKKTILDIAYYWFIKNLNPKSERKNKVNLQNEIKNLVQDTKVLPMAVIEKQLPSQKMKEQLYFYKIRARTAYNEIDAPSFQLENYHTHQVGYIQANKSKPEEDQAEKRRKRLLRIQFKRPNLDQYNQMFEQKKQEELKNVVAEQLVLSSHQVEGEVKPVIQGEIKAEVVVTELTQEQQNAIDLINEMGGEAEEVEEVLEEEEDKQKGKLDPFVKAFLLKREEEKEAKPFQYPQIDNRIRFKSNYAEILDKEDENFAKMMTEWASKKSRFKSEQSRKIQSLRAFNSVINPNILHDKKPFLEETMAQKRINETLKDYKKYIKGDLNRESLNAEAGFSMFDRKRIKTECPKEHFSNILEENKRINKREDYLDEIEYIKLKFAKDKIYAPLNLMKNALLHPEEKNQDELTQKIEYPSTLLSNPFFVVKKKKKKGKKKK